MGALLAVALLPLVLMGFGAWVVFGRLLESKAIDLQRAIVQAHAHSIEAYLATQRGLLQLLASTRGRTDLAQEETLRDLLATLNRTSGDAFVDLGVIDSEGRHLAYAGPYDLRHRNYHETAWFREVMARGVFTSDVFLGFREVPHFVIAIRRQEAGDAWILRATINSEQFDAQVATTSLGRSGEAFVVSRDGLYQTRPSVGEVLGPARLPPLTPHRGVRDQRVRQDGSEKLLVTTWINQARWVLAVQQDVREVRAPVTRAAVAGALLTAATVILVVLTTSLATRHLLREIDRATEEREQIARALTRSAKLASIGEMATGLAHEINTPLAVIAAEQTNISDLIPEAPLDERLAGALRESVARIARQVERCAAITRKMLQFGRKRETSLQPTDVERALGEIVGLLGRQAAVGNVDILLEVEAGLPRALVDPLELEQVLANLFTNAFQAMPDGGRLVARASRRGGELQLEVQDDGQGMPDEVRERAFEPFFTTKPVGQGTGLGLSVCYGMVQSWGGRMEIGSELGRGTTVTVHLPLGEVEEAS